MDTYVLSVEIVNDAIREEEKQLAASHRVHTRSELYIRSHWRKYRGSPNICCSSHDRPRRTKEWPSQVEGETHLKITESIRLFQSFDGELQEACRSLNVIVVRRMLFVNQGDLSFDLLVDVGQQVVFLLLQCFDDLIDVFDDLRAKAFAIFLSSEIHQCIVITSWGRFTSICSGVDFSWAKKSAAHLAFSDKLCSWPDKWV